MYYLRLLLYDDFCVGVRDFLQNLFLLICAFARFLILFSDLPRCFIFFLGCQAFLTIARINIACWELEASLERRTVSLGESNFAEEEVGDKKKLLLVITGDLEWRTLGLGDPTMLYMKYVIKYIFRVLLKYSGRAEISFRQIFFQGRAGNLLWLHLGRVSFPAGTRTLRILHSHCRGTASLSSGIEKSNVYLKCKACIFILSLPQVK